MGYGFLFWVVCDLRWIYIDAGKRAGGCFLLSFVMFLPIAVWNNACCKRKGRLKTCFPVFRRPF
ncbi:hypothetical protein HMPREF1051_1653 [Neisseria sicca VK64]|uniref:Uncharacterized protein n=1 Tax=Neisseria sicca VK64 TaxID=1095748 RepID=I2NJV4_NEISI|nr:hypothetical protein HMPREF1051_1653 [Neisseria sicca VK64]